jgi:large subunit ribosomal protein L4e
MAERKSSKTGEKGKAATEKKAAREEAPKKEGKKIIEKAKAKGAAEEKKAAEGTKAAEKMKVKAKETAEEKKGTEKVKGKELEKTESAAKEEVKEAAKSAVVKEAVKKAEEKKGTEEAPKKEGKVTERKKTGEEAKAAEEKKKAEKLRLEALKAKVEEVRRLKAAEEAPKVQETPPLKTKVYSLDGSEIKEIEVPPVFRNGIDKRLIKRAVLAVESSGFQPKGVKPNAGRNTTAEYIGSRLKPQRHRLINIGHARLPRKKNSRSILSGDVAGVPQAVGGPKAHPPKTAKRVEERINKKERRKAVSSAISATALKSMVKERGHRFSNSLSFPVVAESRLETLEKTKNVVIFMKALGIEEDVIRAKKRKAVRAGKGKKRGRKYRKAKSILFVVKDSSKIYRAARNIEGVDVTTLANLNAKLLAPGAHAGRLTVWSETAIEKMRGS